jgi:hypothetical protein
MRLGSFARIKVFVIMTQRAVLAAAATRLLIGGGA